MSCVIGAVVMLLIQYYAFVRYFDASEEEKKNEENRSGEHQRFELPVVSVVCEGGLCDDNKINSIIVLL